MIIVSNSAFSFDDITSPLILEDSQKKYTKLKFGINRIATDTVDLDLGENYDLPGPPPSSSGLYAIFKILNPRTLEKTSSYLDYRSFPEIRGDSVVFEFVTYYTIDYLKLKWAPFNPEQVDSAFIEDQYGAGIKFDMLQSTEATVDNPSIAKFTIKIWYSDEVASVNDYEDDLKIFPNPAKNIVTINSKLTGSTFYISNSNGLMINKGIIETENYNIDIGSCPQGMYYLVINHFNRIYFRKIIILN